MYAAASLKVNGKVVATDWKWGYSPVAVTTTSVTRSSSPVNLLCELEGSGYSLSASYTVEPVPTGEDTASTGWENNETRHTFEMTLTGTGPFSGRRVREEDAGGGYDSCYRDGSPVARLDHVTGGNWEVQTGNTWCPTSLVGVPWVSTGTGRTARFRAAVSWCRECGSVDQQSHTSR